MADVDEVMAEGQRAYRANEPTLARKAFRRVVELRPQDAEAWYFLGLLHYAAGQWLDALACLDRTLAVQPSHVNARKYRDLVAQAEVRARPHAEAPPAPVPAAAVPPVPSTPLGEVELALDSRYGVYEVLSMSQDSLVRQPLAMMDALRVTTRPRRTAFLYRFLAHLVGALLVGYVIAQVVQTVQHLANGHSRAYATAPGILLITAVIAAPLWIWQVIQISVTRYELDKGRLQIRAGVFVHRTTNLELFRVNNVVLVRNPIQRLTGDGRLEFHTTHEVLRAVGITHGDDLDVIFRQLLDLVFALRANNYVRGIIS